MRQVVLDTETTGMRAGVDRIVEIGAVEIVNRRLGAQFHGYFNPYPIRVDPEALKVHGLTDEFLADHPPFKQREAEFRTFLMGADEVIIHNAPFDCRFLTAELIGASYLDKVGEGFSGLYKVVDTLKLARSYAPGKRSYRLDALAKHYGIEGRDGELHGALLDSTILAKVYLAMTAGQEKMELAPKVPAPTGPWVLASRMERKVYLATPEEAALHAEFCKANNIPVF